jgi:putative hydrolase of HD superfamily
VSGSERLLEQLAFVDEMDKAKGVFRRSHLVGEDRNEDDAQHQWHFAVMALILAEHAAEPIDVGRVVAMALLHDVVEIDAGDAFVYDESARAEKAAREQAAADRIFNLLPPDQARFVRELWDEFEARETPEARYAAAIDRTQALMQNLRTNGAAWREHGIVASQVFALNEQIGLGAPTLWEEIRGRIERAVDEGVLPA